MKLQRPETLILPKASESSQSRVVDFACTALVFSVFGIAVAYAAAFFPGGAPSWAPWLLALGIPIAIGAIMILGATRGRRGVGPLKIPFAFVVATLAAGFCAALVLPASENPSSELWLGLPARAAIVIYGIGLLPTIVLPIAYALTFESQTLTAEDIERVRSLAREIEKERLSLASDSPASAQ